jgi:WD40 repeat protein
MGKQEIVMALARLGQLMFFIQQSLAATARCGTYGVSGLVSLLTWCLVILCFSEAANSFRAFAQEKLPKGELQCLHQDSIPLVVFSPDGKWVATYSEDISFQIWDTRNYKLKALFRPKDYLGDAFTSESLEFSKDSSCLLWGNYEGVWQWDWQNSAQPKKVASCRTEFVDFLGADWPFVICAVKPSIFTDKWLAYSDTSGRVTLYSQVTGKGSVSRTEIARSVRDTKDVKECAFAWSPKKDMLANVENDKSIRLISDDGKTQPKHLRASKTFVRSIFFSLDGERLIGFPNKDEIYIWTISTNELVTLSTAHKAFSSTAYSAVNDTIGIANCETGQIDIWSLRSKKKTFQFQGQPNAISCVCFSPNGRTLVSSGEEKLLRFFSLNRETIGKNR